MTDGKGALHRIRVIDLGRHRAGPRCAPPPGVEPAAILGLGVLSATRPGMIPRRRD